MRGGLGDSAIDHTAVDKARIDAMVLRNMQLIPLHVRSSHFSFLVAGRMRFATIERVCRLKNAMDRFPASALKSRCVDVQSDLCQPGSFWVGFQYAAHIGSRAGPSCTCLVLVFHCGPTIDRLRKAETGRSYSSTGTCLLPTGSQRQLTALPQTLKPQPSNGRFHPPSSITSTALSPMPLSLSTRPQGAPPTIAISPTKKFDLATRPSAQKPNSGQFLWI